MAAALKKATALQGTTASQVMDAQTLTKLNDAIADAQNMKTVGGCEVSQSDSALRQHARSMSKQLSGIKENTKALTSATTAVTDSKAAKMKQDAIDQARTSLRNAIDTAQELLDGSPYKVADNCHARGIGKRHQHRTGTDRRQQYGHQGHAERRQRPNHRLRWRECFHRRTELG